MKKYSLSLYYCVDDVCTKGNFRSCFFLSLLKILRRINHRIYYTLAHYFLLHIMLHNRCAAYFFNYFNGSQIRQQQHRNQAQHSPNNHPKLSSDHVDNVYCYVSVCASRQTSLSPKHTPSLTASKLLRTNQYGGITATRARLADAIINKSCTFANFQIYMT